jgi:Na+-translocating ferredoxin:NAD+ oxidoreductase subunit A
MIYIIIILNAILVNNIVLRQFLGICPFLGVSSKTSTAVGMGAAVLFVMTLATLVTSVLYSLVLKPLNIEFLQTVSFILVIASLVQLVEIVLKKISPPLYQALGIFLPLITTNCAILGVALIVIKNEYTIAESVVFAIATALGFMMALVIFSGIRERLSLLKVPKQMQGAPIALVTAGLLALAFMGFTGIV